MLKLSPFSQTNTATGIILNYITVDIVRTRRFCSKLYEFLYCPAVVSLIEFKDSIE